MLVLLPDRFTRRILGTFLFEVFATIVCMSLVPLARAALFGHSVPASGVAAFALLALLILQVSLWACGAYLREVVYSRSRASSSLAGGFLLGAPLLLLLCWLFSLSGAAVFALSEGYFFSLVAVYVACIVFERSLVFRIFDRLSHLGDILLVGTSRSAARAVREATQRCGPKLHFAGVLSEDPSLVGRDFGGIPVLGSVRQLESVLEKADVDTVLVGLPYYHPDLPLDTLCDCRVKGLLVMDIGGFYEATTQKVLLERIDPEAKISPSYCPVGRFRWALKDLLERAIAAFALLLLLPVFAVVAPLVWLTSRGSVLVGDRIAGKEGRATTVYRLRTTERTAGGEERLTPFGRWLAATHMDALPLLWSVLRGDLAVIGPHLERIERSVALRQAFPVHRHRELVKPGLFGWAQVRFPRGTSAEDEREKLRHDLYYIKNMSPLFDVVIVAATAVSALSRRPWGLPRWKV